MQYQRRDATQYQWSRGGGGGVARGRGGGVARGNFQERPDARPRFPINDPQEETVGKLPKGKFWHDSSDPTCCCKTPDCGIRQEVPFCQGCGQHHHEREFCYKGQDHRYNKTGYWCDNRKSQPPIQSLGGSYPGASSARAANNFQEPQPMIPPPPPGKAVGFNMMEGTGRA